MREACKAPPFITTNGIALLSAVDCHHLQVFFHTGICTRPLQDGRRHAKQPVLLLLLLLLLLRRGRCKMARERRVCAHRVEPDPRLHCVAGVEEDAALLALGHGAALAVQLVRQQHAVGRRELEQRDRHEGALLGPARAVHHDAVVPHNCPAPLPLVQQVLAARAQPPAVPRPLLASASHAPPAAPSAAPLSPPLETSGSPLGSSFVSLMLLLLVMLVLFLLLLFLLLMGRVGVGLVVAGALWALAP